MREVTLDRRSTTGFSELVDPVDLTRYEMAVASGADRLGDRTLWHVNSTAEGGGVAELLHALLGYLLDGGITTRWLVVEGNPDFFRVTKRIHNQLHASEGDGGPLGVDERRVYDAALAPNLEAILDLVRPGDVVVLHDPQTAGLAPALAAAGVHVIWVCHVGIDRPDHLARSAWAFLGADVGAAAAYVFTREAYVWDGLDRERVAIIPPCIDPASPKNAPIDPPTRNAVLAAAGLLEAPPGDPTTELPDGSIVRITRRASMLEERPVPATAPLVLQVSRWDRLKDPLGVLRGFVDRVPIDDAHLMLAGPAADGVADDPEGIDVLTQVRVAWQALPTAARRRVHLASLPVDDLVENAVVVNALQRFAHVVVQKSLAEGFGLTVTEAMWKERPVIGSRVGGIQDQIVDGESGLLVNPTDLVAYGDAVARLLRDQLLAVEIGHGARARVRERFLAPHFLSAHLELMDRVIATSGG
jgi:trehalose synthase